MQYENPIIPGFYPDPSICCGDDYYYLVTSSFEFFPGVPLFRSKNLTDWECIGHCLSDKSQLCLKGCRASGGIYAPTIRFHEGTFFMVVTNVSHRGNMIVHTKNPAGKWSEPVFVKQGGIDPSLLFDGNKVYFVSNGDTEGNSGIYLCEINPYTGEMLSDSVLISTGCGGRCAEAPHVYHIGDAYYLMLAEGGTEYGHMVTISRSKNIYGPYEPCPHNPIISHRDLYTSPIQCTGHADLLQDKNGNWWLVCLGVRPLASSTGGAFLHNLGRETFLAPVSFQDGWPVAGNNGTLSLTMDGPLPEKPLQSFPSDSAFIKAPVLEEHFDKEVLHPQFAFIRNPYPDNYELQSDKHRIILKGSERTLSCPDDSPAFLGVRQTAFCQEAQVKVTLKDVKEDSCRKPAAGLTVFYNNEHHYDLLLTCDKEGYKLKLRRQLYDLCAVTEEVSIPLNTVLLKITADCDYYSFYYALSDGNYRLLGKGAAAGMCTEITRFMTFTGTFFGMFAENTAACFEEFSRKTL